VLAMIELSHHTTLLGNQFVLISEQLANIDSSVDDPDDVPEKLVRMTSLAGVQLRKAVAAFGACDLAAARQVETDDDQLDVLNREIAEIAVRTGATHEERKLQFRRVLIARSLERIGDSAVDIAEQAAFVLTDRQLSHVVCSGVTGLG
jgi:phosphate uptake regulator